MIYVLWVNGNFTEEFILVRATRKLRQGWWTKFSEKIYDAYYSTDSALNLLDEFKLKLEKVQGLEVLDYKELR
ncbi:hypothetical protein LCGC14_2400120 [marine sediment metagenome]|uniref:Uncharacterized protein n=1 Tax=marine sediment metagenome TaxID=412755 RepID=A0A0F9CHP1_9ZZZZ